MVKRNNNKLRHSIQTIWSIVTNSYVIGFVQGKIYQGPIKNICVPGLNCYSCPGAIGSCPIGSLQAIIGSYKYKISFYIIGFLMMIGALSGRFICGWMCPFGLVQDLLHKIPFPKKIKTFKGDKQLRYLKYIIFVVFVILMPLYMVDVIGQGMPYFCKLICPSGTLLGGLPLLSANEALREIVGWLFIWKNAILICVIIASIIIYRPFCKYICPLGGIYAIFNPISFYKLKVNKNKCTHCGMCSKSCKMNIDPVKIPNSLECIRCGDCKKVCRQQAIDMGISKYKN